MQSADQMEHGIRGGFLFLRCLGLGFVLELVLGDEGRRSEAPGPGWRLSRGGISQERGPERLPRSLRPCSRELGSKGKTSLACFSLLQPLSREQGMLRLGGSSCSLFPSFRCSNNLPSASATAFSPPARFSPAQKNEPKRLLSAPGGCEQICLPELGGGCFPSANVASETRRGGGAEFGAQPGSLPYSAACFFYKTQLLIASAVIII